MEVVEILLIILIHTISDFIFQAEEWALNKSKSNIALFKHTLTYSLVWIPLSLSLFIFTDLTIVEFLSKLPIFILITFIIHTLTDYVTSRIVSKRFKDGHLGSNIPNLGAFTIIGFDQVLHYIQLFFSYDLIFK